MASGEPLRKYSEKHFKPNDSVYARISQKVQYDANDKEKSPYFPKNIHASRIQVFGSTGIETKRRSTEDVTKCDEASPSVFRKPSLLRSPSPVSPAVIPENTQRTIEITAATQTPKRESVDITEVKQKFLSQLDLDSVEDLL